VKVLFRETFHFYVTHIAFIVEGEIAMPIRKRTRAPIRQLFPLQLDKSKKTLLVLAGAAYLFLAPPSYGATLGATAGAPDPASSFSATTGIYSDTSSDVAFSSGGSTVATINASGIGIGTTAFAGFGLVVHNTDILVDAAGFGVRLPSSGGPVEAVSTSSVISNLLYVGDSVGYSGIGFRPGASETMRITTGGNVGIGTTAPDALLSLGGQAAQVIDMVRETTASTNGNDLTVKAGGSTSGGTNLNGGNLNLSSGTSTGTGTSGINFKVYEAGASGTADNSPTTAMIISGTGNVGIGSTSPAVALDVNGAVNANSLTLNHLPVPLVPTGRLTLSSTAPVMTADSVNATTIYYLPYVGQNVVTYNGTNWTEQDIGSSGVSLALSTTNMPTSEVFDVYASIQSGSVTLCSLYWGSNTSRSSTAGGKSGTQDARIVQLNGIWANKTAIAASNCYNNATAYTIAQNQGTYLGTFYTNAAGAVSFNMKPAAAAGGSANIVGLSNAYNRVHVSSVEQDSTTSWTYATAAWEAADNSSKNSVTFVDGLQQSTIDSYSFVLVVSGTAGNALTWGHNLDSTSAAPGLKLFHAFPTSTVNNNYGDVAVSESFPPQLGLHYVQAMQFANTGTTTFNVPGTQYALIVSLDY
jgi:hypothetical protein